MLWLPGARLPLTAPSGFRLVNAGEGAVGEGWSTGRTPYRAEHPSLQWVLEGGGAITVDGARLELAPGTIAIVPGQRWLRRQGGSGLRLRWIGFRCEPARAEHALAAPAALAVGADDRPAIAAGMRAALQPDGPAAAARIVAALATACALLAAAADDAAPPAPAPAPAVERALAFLDRHYRRMPALAEVAHAAGRSPNHLHQAFRAALGCTPAAYAERLRLRDAQLLLADPALTVAEVARRCGYADPFHFSRVVRRACGASPLILRRRLGAG